MANNGYDRSITMPFELIQQGGERGTEFTAGYWPETVNGKHTGKWIFRTPEAEEFRKKEGWVAKPTSWVKVYPDAGYNAQGKARGNTYTGVFQDSLNNYIQVDGTKKEMEKKAQAWQYNIYRRKYFDYPTPELITERPSSEVDNDMHGAFIPEFGYKMGEPITVPKDEQDLGASNLVFGKTYHEYDVRGEETVTGQFKEFKGDITTALAGRYAGDTIGVATDLIKFAVPAITRTYAEALNVFVRTPDWLRRKGTGVVGKIWGIREWEEIGKETFDYEDTFGYNATYISDLGKDNWFTQLSSYLPGSVDMKMSGLKQPDDKEAAQGMAYYSGEDIENFIKNPQASYWYKVAKEIGLGWWMMKATNWALRTVPKAVNAYKFYSLKGKNFAWEKHVNKIRKEQDLIKTMTKKEKKAYFAKYGPEGKYGRIPDEDNFKLMQRNTRLDPSYNGENVIYNKQFEKVWKESSKWQRDEYATYALQKNIAAYGRNNSLAASKYFAFTRSMRLDIGKKLTYAGPTLFFGEKVARIPKKSYGPMPKDPRTLQPYQNFFTSEEWAANVNASFGAVTMGEMFKEWFGDDKWYSGETAGYIIGGLGFAVIGTTMWNKGFPLAAVGVSHFTGATGGPLDLKRINDYLRGRENILDWTKRNPDGSTSPLSAFERRQIEMLRVWVNKMDPARKENVLNRIEHYDGLLRKLVGMGGDYELLAQKIGDVADITAVRLLSTHINEDLNLGGGVNLNIKNIETTFERRKKQLIEIGDLIKRIINPKTKAALADGEVEIVDMLNDFFVKDLNRIQLIQGSLNASDKLARIILRPSQNTISGDVTEEVAEAYKELHNVGKSFLVKYYVGDVNVEDVNVEELVKAVREPYKQVEELQKKLIAETVAKYRKAKDVDPEEIGRDFVKIFELSQERRMAKAGELLDPLWVKIQGGGDLDISDWANTFLVQGTDILDDSATSANKLTREVIVDSGLIEDVLGSFIRGKMKKKFTDMAAADTSGRSAGELMSFYQKRFQKNYEGTLDLTDGLSVYRWLKNDKVSKNQKDEFKLIFGENIANLKVDVKDLTKIYTNLSVHIRRLQKKGDKDPFTLNTIQTLKKFQGQLDELFSAKYGNANLSEWIDSRKLYAADIAPFYNSRFKKVFANYNRTLVNLDDGPVHESGSNHLYGYDEKGIQGHSWLPEIIKMIHSGEEGAREAAILLNEAFGERVLVNGVLDFKIIDPELQVGIGELIQQGLTRYNHGAMDKFVEELNWDIAKASVRGTANFASTIRSNYANEIVFANKLAVPKGTVQVSGEKNIPVGKSTLNDTIIYTPADSSARINWLRELAETDPVLKKAMDAWDDKMELALVGLDKVVQKEFANLNFEKNLMDDFLNTINFRLIDEKALEEGKKPTMSIDHLYKFFLATGGTENLKQYQDYFIQSLKEANITHEVTVEKMWKDHVSKIVSHGFERNQMDPVILHGKPLTETKVGADNKFYQQVQKVFGDEALDHLQQNAAVYKEAWGKEVYENMIDITNFFMYGDITGGDIAKVAGKIKNMPMEMALQSVMSRIYALQRDVVSPRWVITEMLLHSVRKKRMNFLSLLIKNPDMIKFVKEAITVAERGGQKTYGRKPIAINEDMHTRFNNMLLKSINEAWAEDTAMESVFPFTFEYYQLDEEGRLEAPEEGSIIEVPRRRSFKSGGIIDQMNNLNFQ